MKVIKPPSAIKKESFVNPSLALFGSIEMGKAEDWQTKVQNWLKDFEIDIYNPRRDHWDNSWEQSKDNARFREQVEWELTVLENADVRIFYFDPTTKSPVTLMELGLCFGVGTLDTIVCCPEGFWRKGNVDIVCERYGIHQVKTLEDAVFDATSRLTHHYNVKRPEKLHVPIVQEPIQPVIEDPFRE